jgi:hypothetical protein
LIAPQVAFYPSDRTQDALLALRELFSRNPCAAQFDAETLAKLLYMEGYLSHRIEVYQVEGALEALIVKGEILG